MEEPMHSLKQNLRRHLLDIYAALVIILAALAVGGLQLVLPHLA